MNGLPSLTVEDFDEPKTVSQDESGFPTLTLEDFGDAEESRTSIKTGSAEKGSDRGTEESLHLRRPQTNWLGSINAEKGIRRALNLPVEGPISKEDIASVLAPSRPLIGGEFIQREERPESEVAKSFEKATFGKEFLPEKAREPIGSVLKAGFNTVADTVNFFNSPEGAAITMATGGAAAFKPAVGRLVALGFGADAARNTMDAVLEGRWSDALESLGLGALLGFGAKTQAKAEFPVARPQPRIERTIETAATELEKPPVQAIAEPARGEPTLSIESPEGVAHAPEPARTETGFPELTEAELSQPIPEKVLAQMEPDQPALYFEREKLQEFPVAEEQLRSELEEGIYETERPETRTSGMEPERVGVIEPTGIERAEPAREGTEAAPVDERSRARQQAFEGAYRLSDDIARRVATGQPDSVIEAAQKAAYDNARGSISQTGRFNQDFMVKSAMRAAGRESERLAESMDKPIGEGETATLHDIIPADIVPPDRAVASAERRTNVSKLISELPERDQAIVRGVSMEGRTIEDMAAELGISHQRVSQLHTKALDTLRRRMGETEAGLRFERQGKPGGVARSPYPDYALTDEARSQINDISDTPVFAALRQEIAAGGEGYRKLASSLRQVDPRRSAEGAISYRPLASVDALLRSFGAEPLYVRGLKENTGAGAAYAPRSRAVLFDVEAKAKTVEELIGHEIGHHIKNIAPDVYDAMAKEVGRTRPKYRGQYERELLDLKYKPEQLRDELLNDLIGETLRDPTRLKMALGENVGLFRQTMMHIRDWIEQTLRKLRLLPQRGAFQAFRDLSKARNTISDTLIRSREISALRGKATSKKLGAVISALDDITAQGVSKIDSPAQYRVPLGEAMSHWKRRAHQIRQTPKQLKEVNLALTPMDWVFQVFDRKANGTLWQNMKLPVDAAYSKFLNATAPLKNRLARIANEHKLDDGNYNRIYAHAELRQAGGKENLQALGYTDKELASVKTLTNGEQAYLKEADSILKNLYKEHSDYLKTRGVDLGETPNYFPRQRDWDQYNSLSIDDPNRLAMAYRRQQPTTTSSKARTGGVGKNIANAHEVMMNHIDDVLYQTKMGPELKRIADIVRSEQFGDLTGSYGQNIFADWVDTLARNGGVGAGRGLRELIKNVGVMQLGFRLTTTALQPLAIIQAMPFISKGSLTRSISSVASKSNRQWILENFPEVRARIGDDPAYSGYTGKSIRDKFGRAGFKAIGTLDRLAAMTIAESAYRDSLAQRGITFDRSQLVHPEAVQEAQAIVRKTQASPFPKDAPAALSHGYFTGSAAVNKAILQFQNYIMNRWALFKHAGLQMGIKEKSPVAGARVMTYLLLSSVVEQLSREGIAGALRLMFGTSKAEDSRLKKESEKNFATRIIARGAEDLLFSAPVISNIHGAIRYNSSGIPIADTLLDTVKGAVSVSKGKPEGAARVVQGIGGLYGLPTGQIGDILVRMIKSHTQPPIRYSRQTPSVSIYRNSQIRRKNIVH